MHSKHANHGAESEFCDLLTLGENRMRHKRLCMFVAFVLLLSSSAVLSQVVGTRVLLQGPSIKVLAADTFPKDLSCEIYVGGSVLPTALLHGSVTPSFSTEGRDGRLETATLMLGLRASVSARRKAGAKEAYILTLFTEDRERKVVALYDLDIDGQWDVKKTPTRDRKNFIRLDAQWLEVDKIDGLRSDHVTAVLKGTRFAFREGKWHRSDDDGGR